MGGGKRELKKTMIIAMMMMMRLIIGKRDREKALGGREGVGEEEEVREIWDEKMEEEQEKNGQIMRY